MKITIENQSILKRLQDKTSNYSVLKWEEDFRETEKRMKNMCEYPLVFNNLNKNGSNLDDPQRISGTRFQTADGSSNGFDDTGLLSRGGPGLPRIGTAQTQQRGINNKSFTSIGGVNSATHSTLGINNERRVLIKQAESLDENRIVLYKKGRHLGNNGYYIVEISSNN